MLCFEKEEILGNDAETEIKYSYFHLKLKVFPWNCYYWNLKCIAVDQEYIL